MGKTFENGRASNGGDSNVSVITTKDPRIESWEDGPLGVDFRVLRFAGIVPEDTEDNGVKNALGRVTGAKDFRLARADPETEARWRTNVETAAAALTIRSSSAERIKELDKLRGELLELAEKYPDEALSIEQQLMDLDDTRLISEENARKNYDDLLTMLYADYHVKLQAAADLSNRNLQVYEEHSREITFRETNKKAIESFFKDEDSL